MDWKQRQTNSKNFFGPLKGKKLFSHQILNSLLSSGNFFYSFCYEKLFFLLPPEKWIERWSCQHTKRCCYLYVVKQLNPIYLNCSCSECSLLKSPEFYFQITKKIFCFQPLSIFKICTTFQLPKVNNKLYFSYRKGAR